MTYQAIGWSYSVVVPMATIGCACGLLYFAALRRTVDMYALGKSWFVLSAMTLGRMGAATVVLFLAARLGAAALLAVLAGFLIARTLAVRAARSRA